MSAAGAGSVAVNFPALPQYENRTSTTGPTTGTDTKTERLSDEQTTALDKTRAATDAGIAATSDVRRQQEREAQVAQQDVELQQFAAESEQQLRTGPEAQAAKAYVNWARDRTKQEEARLAAMPPPRYFRSGDGWGNVRKAVALGLAGIGDGMVASAAILAGHAPTTGHTAAQIIDRELDQQRAAIDKQKDSVLMARTGLKDADEARRAVMAELDLKAKYMYKAAENLTRARLAALKVDQAAIDQTKEIVELRAKQANAEAEYVKSHTVSATNRWDSAKTTTERIDRAPTTANAGEGKIPGQQAALARQALAELEKLEGGPLPGPETLKKVQDNDLQSTAADTSIEGGKLLSGGIAAGGRALDIVPRNRYEGLPEQDRITVQAMDRTQQLLMHVMTGAGASAAEAKKKAEAFGWVPGDTPASMKAKISGAKDLARQFINTPGAAAPQAAPSADAPAARGPSVQASAPDGKPKKVVEAEKALAAGSGADEEDKRVARKILLDYRAKQKGKK